jgi:hypothetical protein
MANGATEGRPNPNGARTKSSPRRALSADGALTYFKVLNRYSVTSCSGLAGVTSAEVKLG